MVNQPRSTLTCWKPAQPSVARICSQGTCGYETRIFPLESAVVRVHETFVDGDSEDRYVRSDVSGIGQETVASLPFGDRA